MSRLFALALFTFIMSGVVFPGERSDERDERALADVIGSAIPWPDAVGDAIESPDPHDRVLACKALLKWWPHIPGAASSLRRLMHDQERSVQLNAIRTAVRRANRVDRQARTARQRVTAEAEMHELIGFVAEAVLRMGNDLTPDQRDGLTDTLDRRHVRPFWKEVDVFGLRDWMVQSMAQRSREHDLERLMRQRIPEPTADVIASGRNAFTVASCVTCHRVGGIGHSFAPELVGIGQCYDNQALIQHIVDPSLDIHDDGRAEKILTVGGRVWIGKLLEDPQTNDLLIRVDPMQPNRLRRVAQDEVVIRQPSPVSPMPAGLLNRLTLTQVADLVAYLRSDAGALGVLPAGNHEDH